MTSRTVKYLHPPHIKYWHICPYFLVNERSTSTSIVCSRNDNIHVWNLQRPL